jgi:hypothetical protein
MPAIFHQSPGMAARGLSLIDQSIARQPSGLVNVVVKYAAPAASVDQLLPQFGIDSEPPIFPDIIDPRELQTQRLYLQNFTADKTAGIATINAQYCGALLRGLQTPYQTNQYERGAVQMRITSVRETGNFGQGVFTRPGFDRYVFAYRARIAYYEVATVGLVDFDFDPPGLVNSPDADGLIVGWSIRSRELARTDNDINQYEFLPGFYKRDFTAQEWLEFIASLNDQLNDFFKAVIVIEDELDNVTPTVKVLRKRVSLAFPSTFFL